MCNTQQPSLFDGNAVAVPETGVVVACQQAEETVTPEKKNEVKEVVVSEAPKAEISVEPASVSAGPKNILQEIFGAAYVAPVNKEEEKGKAGEEKTPVGPCAADSPFAQKISLSVPFRPSERVVYVPTKGVASVAERRVIVETAYPEVVENGVTLLKSLPEAPAGAGHTPFYHREAKPRLTPKDANYRGSFQEARDKAERRSKNQAISPTGEEVFWDCENYVGMSKMVGIPCFLVGYSPYARSSFGPKSMLFMKNKVEDDDMDGAKVFTNCGSIVKKCKDLTAANRLPVRVKIRHVKNNSYAMDIIDT